jgi:hypothetical protein
MPSHPQDDLFTTFAERVMRRAEEVDANLHCKWPISEDQRTLLRLLKPRQGRDRAIALGDLCERMRVTPRIVKDLVQDLRLNFGVQIGASRDSQAGGYYLIATEAESVESTTQMLHQAITMLEVVRVMRGHATVLEMLGQASLNLEEGSHS